MTIWKTTFDCPEWNQSEGNPDCDGLLKWGGWECNGLKEQITTAANRTTGAGGKGQRHWVGDGININSGGIKHEFPKRMHEFNYRWYMRWEKGFKWDPYPMQKLLYFDVNTTHACIPHLYYYNNFRVVNNGVTEAQCDFGWNNMMINGDLVDGNRASDGEWHCMEVHIKCNSAVDVHDGIFEFWVDGQQLISQSGVNYNTTDYGWVLIGCNQKYPSNGRCMAVDFDDVVLSDEGYIGMEPITTPPQEIIQPEVINLTFSPVIIKEGMGWTAITTVQNPNDTPVGNVQVGFYHKDTPETIFHTIENISILAQSNITVETIFTPWKGNKYQICARVLGE